jgi:D-amino peptidase
VTVKHAHDRFAADLLPVAQAHQDIEAAVATVLSTRPRAAEATREQSTLAVRWQSTSVATTLAGIPGVTTTDSRTTQATGELPALYRLFGIWMRVAASLTNQAPYC